MQFEDPRSILESAAAKPGRELDPRALMNRGRRLRRARYAAVAAGLAVVVAGASASVGLIGGSDRRSPQRPATGECRPDDTACIARSGLCARPLPLEAVIYLREGASRTEALRFQKSLLARPGIESVVYVSKHEAYDRFVQLSEGQPELSRTVDRGDLPASLSVTVTDEATLRSMHEIASPHVDEVRTTLEARERICNGDAPPARVHGSRWDVERYEPTALVPRADPTLLAAECASGPSYVTQTHFLESSEKKWCRFDVRIANLGGSPIEFPYSDQLLHFGGTAIPPWSSGDGSEAPFFARPLFHDELRPGAASSAPLIFILDQEDVPEKLELWGSDRSSPIVFTLDYDCMADLRPDRDGVCSFAGELRDPAYGMEEGPVEVMLYHCGVDPVAFGGRQWVVTEPPFDATNAPDDFTGRGRFEVVSGREAVYVDDSGHRLDFEAIERWTPPPCE